MAKKQTVGVLVYALPALYVPIHNEKLPISDKVSIYAHKTPAELRYLIGITESAIRTTNRHAPAGFLDLDTKPEWRELVIQFGVGHQIATPDYDRIGWYLCLDPRGLEECHGR